MRHCLIKAMLAPCDMRPGLLVMVLQQCHVYTLWMATLLAPNIKANLLQTSQLVFTITHLLLSTASVLACCC